MRTTSFCLILILLFLVMVSFTISTIGLATDYWYFVSTPKDSIQLPETKKENNYAFGLWRRCYDDFPDSISELFERSGTHCVRVFKVLLPRSDMKGNMTNDEMTVMHLGRSAIGFAITSAILYLVSIIIVVLGSIPGDCYSVNKASLYLCVIITLILAIVCGIISGVCFVAARDMEIKDLGMYKGLVKSYGWSFELHWIGTGAAILSALFMIILLRRALDSGERFSKNFYDV